MEGEKRAAGRERDRFRVDAKNVEYTIFFQDFSRRAGGFERSAFEQEPLRSELQRQIEIVKRGQDGDAELRYSLQEIELMLNVEVIGRFVEQKKPRFLRQTSRQKHALFFTARERVEAASAESFGVRRAEHFFQDREVLVGIGGKNAFVRMAAHEDQLFDRELETEREFLAQHCDALCELFCRVFVELFVFDADGSGSSFDGAAHRAEQRRFSAAVWADERGEGARFERKRKIVEDALCAEIHAEILNVQHAMLTFRTTRGRQKRSRC